MLVLLALALTACGASGGGTSDAGDALAYLPADPAVVILVSTDLDSEQWREFDRRVVQEIADDDEPAKTFDEYAEEAFRESGVDREDDVKPLLGNDIAVGIEGDPLALLGGDGESSFVAALETRGGEIEAVLEKAGWKPVGEANGATLYKEEQGDDTFAVEDGVFLTAESEAALRRALERRDSEDGLEQRAVTDALAELPEQALARAFGTAAPLAQRAELQRFASLPLVRALETWGPDRRVRGRGDEARRLGPARRGRRRRG